MTTWTCATCGVDHDDLPMCFGAPPPCHLMVPEQEFADRVELTDSLCIVDGSEFFIRGHLEIPVAGLASPFAWSVWCSLSERSFADAMDRWEDPQRAGIEYFGWLCSPLPVYEWTGPLATTVVTGPVGIVPRILVHDCEHALFLDQRDGIAIERVQEIVHELLHGDSDAPT